MLPLTWIVVSKRKMDLLKACSKQDFFLNLCETRSK